MSWILTKNAVLARCNGDEKKAAEYCLDMALCNTLSLETRQEYSTLAKHFLVGVAANV